MKPYEAFFLAFWAFLKWRCRVLLLVGLGSWFFLLSLDVFQEGELDRDLSLVEEAPPAFDGRPLCFFTGAELEEVELVAREDSFFFSCPSSEFSILVFEATSVAMML